MKKEIVSTLLLFTIAFSCRAQNLNYFSVTVEPNNKNYLSIAYKQAYTQTEAKTYKASIDFTLIITKEGSKQKIEWYNMSGKDGKTPAEINGTASLINAISFDKEQFDKCETTQDLKRMTGHITNNSFSHFASITDDEEKGIVYHCFIIQLENGKRGLMWFDASDNNSFNVMLKIES